MSHTRGESGSFFAITRHDEYFLTGGDLFFLIDHVQFRVHRYFFERESPYFRSKLTSGASPGAQKVGTSESSAIIIEDVKPAEFARFLWVFYNPKYSIYHASVDDWSIILRLAHKWTFHEVKDLAIRELERLDSPDIDRIVLYHACEVDRNLLIPQYAALCSREQPLALDEGMRLGLETTLMIARAREYARGTVLPGGVRSPTVAPMAQGEIIALIRQLFGIPSSAVSEVQVSSTITLGAPTTTINGAMGAPLTTSTSTTTTTTTAQPLTNGNGNEGSKHNRKNMPAPGRPAPPPPPSATTAPNGNSTSSAPEAPPKPPLKVDTNTENGVNGTGTLSSENGKPDLMGANGSSPNGDASKDVNKDSGKDNEDASKDGAKEKEKENKDKHRNSVWNGTSPDSGLPRTSNSLIDMTEQAQSNSVQEVMKTEELSGKQSPVPKGGKAKGGWLSSSVRR